MNYPNKYAVCGTCTLKLVAIAYRRTSWFRVLREPLKMSMQALAFVYRIKAKEYMVRTHACYNCIRFYKVALKERSAFFRWFHRWVNPVYDYFLEKVVTHEELIQSRAYAQAATRGELSTSEVNDWMHGIKTGF